MSAVSRLLLPQPICTYAKRKDGAYRVSRLARTALRWSLLCEKVMGFSLRTVQILKFSVATISLSSLILIRRIKRTSIRIYKGVDSRGQASTWMDYVYVTGDTSKVTMVFLYKSPFIGLYANTANLVIYTKRIFTLTDKYLDVSERKPREDDNYLFLELVRTVVCIAYSALRVLSVLVGYALLVDAAFLTLMSIKQLMHLGTHCYQEMYCSFPHVPARVLSA